MEEEREKRLVEEIAKLAEELRDIKEIMKAAETQKREDRRISKRNWSYS